MDMVITYASIQKPLKYVLTIGIPLICMFACFLYVLYVSFQFMFMLPQSHAYVCIHM